MRRAAAVVLGTVTGTALLVGAKVGNASSSDASASSATSTTVVVSGAGPAAAGTPTSGSAHPGATPTSSSAKPTSTAATGTAAPKPTKATKPPAKPTPTPKPPPSGPKDGTYKASAPVKSGRYGTLSMTVTIAGGKITKIAASEDEGETNCYHSACTKLKPEALSAQTASIASVSGATYTSSAFTSSLQAVLNSAKA